MKICREPPGVLGPRACWVAIDGPWLYLSESLLGLLLEIVAEWRSDRNLVG